MKATINGNVRELPEEITIGALLELVGSPVAGVAVARNERVVRRAEYEVDRVAEGDRIEIIRAVAGG